MIVIVIPHFTYQQHFTQLTITSFLISKIPVSLDFLFTSLAIPLQPPHTLNVGKPQSQIH